MRVTIVCLFVLFSVSPDLVSCSLNDFFQHFGSRISDAWYYTWSNIVDNIKKPVKIKRLGTLGKLKTTPQPPLSEKEQKNIEYTKKLDLDLEPKKLQVSKHILTTESHHSAKGENMKRDSGFQTVETGTRSTKLMIPHLEAPKWSGYETWKKMQNPHEYTNEDTYDGDKECDESTHQDSYKGAKVTTTTFAATEDENEIFGVLIFA